jgi:UDP-glucose 4-epimerase
MASESSQRRILVTGSADFVGSELVRRLEQDDRVAHVAGLDFREPRYAFRRAEVITEDLRSSGLKHILEGIRPDTILHLQQIASDQEAAAADGEMHESNVMGTINLVATVQSLPFVRKFVLMSSMHVYGADPVDPAVLTEDLRPRVPAKSKFGGDLSEMEKAVSQLGRSAPNLILTCLRFADIIGPRVNNAISRFLKIPVVPTIMGFDPRLQFCHEEDAVGILQRAAMLDLPGLYNVAGDGVIYLSRAIRLGGCLQVPVASLFVPGVFGWLRTLGLADIQPHHLLLLRYGRAIDNRRLKIKFGYTPRYSSVAAVLDLHNKSSAKHAVLRDIDQSREDRAKAA